MTRACTHTRHYRTDYNGDEDASENEEQPSVVDSWQRTVGEKY